MEIVEPVGLPEEMMSTDQRDALMSLSRVACSTLNLVEQKGAGNIFFAWAGGASWGYVRYCRIHGPNFFAEYDNMQYMANHTPLMWRSVDGDCGVDILKAHYEQHHA